MEEKEMQQATPKADTPEAEQERYVPRPAGQVWLARIGVVIAILLVISQIVGIARGGM